MKKRYGVALPDLADREVALEVAHPNYTASLSTFELAQVIKPRVVEILDLVKRNIEQRMGALGTFSGQRGHYGRRVPHGGPRSGGRRALPFTRTHRQTPRGFGSHRRGGLPRARDRGGARAPRDAPPALSGRAPKPRRSPAAGGGRLERGIGTCDRLRLERPQRSQGFLLVCLPISLLRLSTGSIHQARFQVQPQTQSLTQRSEP